MRTALLLTIWLNAIISTLPARADEDSGQLTVNRRDRNRWTNAGDAPAIVFPEVHCLSGAREQAPAGEAGVQRYLVSRDGGLSRESWRDAGWVTGAGREQAMSITELSEHARALGPMERFILYIFVLPGEPVPPVDGVSLQLCTCGDGFVDADESCDDANRDDGDGCDEECRLEQGYACANVPSRCRPVCGNGVINLGEACDDGNLDESDGCSSTCRLEAGFACAGSPSACARICGNGVVEPGEECDDGNGRDGDGCNVVCRVERGQYCFGSPSICTPTCGGGGLDFGEECDDGNGAPNDGCSPNCALEPGWTCVDEPARCSALCGNGRLDAGKRCDDGNVDDGDGCSATCRVEDGFACAGAPSFCASTCGDGAPDFGEECDDGNLASWDGCDASCAIEPGFRCGGEPSACRALCGDGIVATSEWCDDGGASGGCNSACNVEAGWACWGSPSRCHESCGNGAIDAGEECDDGNLATGDGCDPTCRREPGFTCAGAPSDCVAVCGDGVVASVEGCDDGNIDDGDGCDAACVPGEVDGRGEQDEENADAGDDSDATAAEGVALLTGAPRGGALGCSSLQSPGRLFIAVVLVLGLRLLRRRSARDRGAGLLLVLLSQTADLAHAIDAQGYEPSPQSEDMSTVRSPDVGLPFSPRVALTSIVAHDPLVLETDHGRVSLVHQRVDLVLATSIALTRTVGVAALWSVVPLEQGNARRTAGGFVPVSGHTAGVTDLRLEGRIALFELAKVRLAAIPALVVPTARGAAFSAGGLTIAPGIAASRRLGPVSAGLNLDVRLREHRRVGALDIGSEIGWRAGVAWSGSRVGPGEAGLSLEAFGRAALERPLARVEQSPTEALAAGSYALGTLRIAAGVGMGLVPGYGSPLWRAFVTVGWGPAASPSAQPVDDLALPPVAAAALSEASAGDDGTSPTSEPEAPAPVEAAVPMSAPEPPLPVAVAVEGNDVRFDSPVFFGTGSTVLKPRARAVLDEVATLLVRRADIRRVAVVGHTDERGWVRDNLLLSLRRAKAVRAYLVSCGVDESRLEVVARGEGEPRTTESSGRGLARNRRVQIRILEIAPQNDGTISQATEKPANGS